MSKDLMAFIFAAIGLLSLVVLMAIKVVETEVGIPIVSAIVSGAIFYLFPSPSQGA